MKIGTKNCVKQFYRLAKTATCFGLVLLSYSFAEINGQTFGNLRMGGGGFVSGIITSKTEKDLIYARTDVGGAYRWDAIKKEWIPLNDWTSSTDEGYLGVESLAIDPSNADNLYMSVGISYLNNGKSAILRSTDRGKTFKITEVTSQFKMNGNGMGRNAGEKLAVDPNIGSVLFYGSRDNGLFKSINSGVSWDRVASLNVTTTTTGNGINFVLFDPSSGTTGTATKTMFVGISRTGDNLYRTDDAGATFTAIAGAPTTLMPHRAVLASNGVLYITYINTAGPWDSSKGAIWKYDLASKVWTNITPASITTAFGGISVDPNNPDRVVAASINVYNKQGNNWGDMIFITNSAGSSWTNVVAGDFKFDSNGIEWAKSGESIHWAGSIEFDPFNTKRVFVNSGSGVFLTENIDSTTNVWKFHVKGIEETVPLDMISIPNGPSISVVGDYDGFRYTDVNTYAPQLTPIMGTSYGVAFAALNPKVVVRVGTKLYCSADTGKTWTLGTIKGAQGYVSVSSDGETILHTPDGSSVTYRSTDKGATWTALAVTNITRTVADAVNPSVFYACSGSKMLTSLDRGLSFFAGGTIGSSYSKHIRTVIGHEGHVWVALTSGGLTRSVDYGKTFTTFKNVTACAAVGFGKAAPGATYPTVFIWGVVAGVEGLYFSTDEGVTWNRTNDADHQWGGLQNGQFVVGDMTNLGYVYVSSGGRGIPYARPDYMLSSTKLTVPVGGTTVITPTVLNTDIVSWTWTSSDESIATVNPNGVVAGVAIGSVVITAKADNGKIVTIGVKIATPVTSITITPNTTNVDVAGTVQLTATIAPADATNKTVSWSSVDASVATVSETGLITGVKAGSTIIVAVVDGQVVQIPFTVTGGTTGIITNEQTEEVTIYPNPLNGNQLSIDLSKLSGTTSIKFVNTSGQTELAKSVSNIPLLQLDVKLKPGIYLVQFTNKQNSFVKKLVVE